MTMGTNMEKCGSSDPRKPLPRGELSLWGESDGRTFQRTFTIVREIRNGRGASAICYEAYHKGSGKGVLKEFYPRNAYMLERDPAGRLIPVGKIGSSPAHYEKELFEQALQDYITPYTMLLQAKRTDPDLAAFIPAFELYRGFDSSAGDAGTIYVWTPDPELETFSAVCDAIRRNPEVNPEEKLCRALEAVQTLTRCICALHVSGLLHRDIKPSNFGFLRRGRQTLTETLSLFDVDSVCSAYHVPDEVIGTPGFMEPEARRHGRRATNQTDLYSIGAVLYDAIVIPENAAETGALYQDENYEHLGQLVRNSRLIQASEVNSHPRLCSILTSILQKCLAPRGGRYEDDNDLLTDLNRALYYVQPSGAAGRREGTQWVLADLQKVHGDRAHRSTIQAMQQHLYCHPLYGCSPAEEPELNVLVIGAGKFGQQFADFCLELGQMPYRSSEGLRAKRLCVTVAADDVAGNQTQPGSRELYLEARPELQRFFAVDQENFRPGSYGELHFVNTRLSGTRRRENLENLTRLLKLPGGRALHYVFIALGADELNLEAAQACRTLLDEESRQCPVCFAWEGRQIRKALNPGLMPVYVWDQVDEAPCSSELERMALNVHLVWEKTLNPEDKTVRDAFKAPANYRSCVGNALSVKYKLHGMGLDFGSNDFTQAAGKFTERIRSAPQEKEILIWLEHRRWVTEKVCAGWTQIANLQECLSCKPNDSSRKRHVCLLPSVPHAALQKDAEWKNHPAHWDEAEESELLALDPLEQMSVQLHRVYRRAAQELKQKTLLNSSMLRAISSRAEKDPEMLSAFLEWKACLTDLWNGAGIRASAEPGLRTAFLKSCAVLPPREEAALKQQVEAFTGLFSVITESVRYRDYKQDDVQLVEGIPFILTYTTQMTLVIPYMSGREDGECAWLFANTASAAVINPARILYLCALPSETQLHELEETLPDVVDYLTKKNLRAKVDLVLVLAPDLAEQCSTEWEKRFRDRTGHHLHHLKRLPNVTRDTIAEQVMDYLNHRGLSAGRYAVERNSTELSELLASAGFYAAVPHYRYDLRRMRFENCGGCDLLQYIRKTPKLLVTDLPVFRDAAAQKCAQPEFYTDYRWLWQQYRRSPEVWRFLCCTLDHYRQTHDACACFRACKKNTKTTCQFLLPAVCRASADRILRELVKFGAAEPSSEITGASSDSCVVTIVCQPSSQEPLNLLFANPYRLMEKESLWFRTDPKAGELKIGFDDLLVSEAGLPEEHAEAVGDLLQLFARQGYLRNLMLNGVKASFTYATRQVKKLLTAEDRILKVYLYHKAKELAQFDDVVSGFGIGDENQDLPSGFGCILTKGMSVLFVKCCSSAEAEACKAGFARVAKRCGINAQAVLVSESQTAPRKDADVITVWKSSEIDAIGDTLLKIIHGEYAPAE